MYHFSDFATVKDLPDVVTIPELSQAIGLSPARTYQILDERRIPYIRIQKRIINYSFIPEFILPALRDAYGYIRSFVSDK